MSLDLLRVPELIDIVSPGSGTFWPFFLGNRIIGARHLRMVAPVARLLAVKTDLDAVSEADLGFRVDMVIKVRG